jgi:hypothetical protein
MKHLLLIGFAFLTLNASAQKIDTVKNAIQVKPVLINWINKDTAYQVTWQLFGITRDTTQGCNSYVEIFDRKGKKIADKNVPIDAKTLMAWIDDILIDKYILFALGLEKR